MKRFALVMFFAVLTAVVSSGCYSIERWASTMDDELPKGGEVIFSVPRADLKQQIALVDWNKDGNQDVLASRYGAVLLYLNKGDGSFSREGVVYQVKTLPGEAIGSMAVVDWDKDGVLDYVVHDIKHGRLILEKGKKGK